VGEKAYRAAPTAIVASELLPIAERRRSPVPVKLALAVGHEAFQNSGRDAATTATVFASSSGEGETLHQMCETLASADRDVSPTRFHNSVHNAAAGYWSIATQCRAPSTSVCCHDASFAAGLLEAVSQVLAAEAPVALIAYDHPYPEPLNAVRPIPGDFGVAMLLAPRATERAAAAVDIAFVPQEKSASRAADPGLEKLRAGVPAARCLPLLTALARGSRETVILEYVAGTHLRVAVSPCS
jgi:hypothetical protein